MHIADKQSGFLQGFIAGAVLLAGTGQILANFVGTTSGTFVNPVGPSTMVTTGVGTSAFTWGVGQPAPPSSLNIAGVSFDTPGETLFKVGTLTYYNGTITSGTGADSVSMDVLFNFTDPAGVDRTFIYALSLINTPNTGTAEQQADIVSMSSVPNQTFTVGSTTYTIHLSFANFSASSFGGPNEFRVFENARATADLEGLITSDLTGTGVPDAGSTMPLLGAALASVAGLRRRIAKA